MEDTFKFIEEHRLISSIRTSDHDDAALIVKAVLAGGFKIIEITATIPQAPRLIETIAKKKDIVVGAGLVTDGEVAQRAINAGAQFSSSYYTDKAILTVCKNNNVLVFQGAATPTEIVEANTSGVDLVAVYPSDLLGGPPYLKRVKKSCQVNKLMAVGGVTCENVVDYLRDAVAVTIGPALCEKSLIRAHQWQAITDKAKMFQEKLESIKIAR